MLEKSEKSASRWLKTNNCITMHGQQNIKKARNQVSHTYKPTDAIIFTPRNVTLLTRPRAWRLYRTESLHPPGQPVGATMSRDND
jgi:hypothetical protein